AMFQVRSAVFLSVTDTADCGGRNLLKSLTQAALQREELVHVFGFEVSEFEFTAGLKNEDKWRLVFHDAYSDPLNWDESSSFTPLQFTTQDVLARIGQAPNEDSKSVTLVLDSLSWVLLHNPVTLVCQTLQQLFSGLKVKRVVALLHTDLHEQGVVGSVCHLAGTVVMVAPAPKRPSAETDVEPLALATIVQRKESGKVIKKEEYFTVLEDFNLKVLGEPAQLSRRPEGKEEETAQVGILRALRGWPQGQRLTNMFLLFFLSPPPRKSSLLQPQANQGHIFYEPDAADDVDDEDPDDDLDI
uniref:Elongator complex protein 5 n=1 Tax=Latimeria chalumnae TaxID=7897 RepID=H3AID2_LATCH